MPKNKYTTKIEELEKNERFDENAIPINEKKVKEMNPDKFSYMPRNFFSKLYAFLLHLIIFLFAPLVVWIYFDLKVRGRKNIRKVRKQGAIIISNHVHYLDCMIVRMISGKPMWYLAARENNRKGLAGLTLRSAGLLPLSSNFKIAKLLDSTIADVLKHKHLLTIYPEQSLWLGYTRIRPFKNGAFHFAVKNNVPVIPVVILFREAKWWDKIFNRKYKVTLKILPPIYPDENLSYKPRLLQMKNACHNEMVECANAFYSCESDAVKVVKDASSVTIEEGLEYAIDDNCYIDSMLNSDTTQDVDK